MLITSSFHLLEDISANIERTLMLARGTIIARSYMQLAKSSILTLAKKQLSSTDYPMSNLKSLRTLDKKAWEEAIWHAQTKSTAMGTRDNRTGVTVGDVLRGFKMRELLEMWDTFYVKSSLLLSLVQFEACLSLASPTLPMDGDYSYYT